MRSEHVDVLIIGAVYSSPARSEEPAMAARSGQGSARRSLQALTWIIVGLFVLGLGAPAIADARPREAPPLVRKNAKDLTAKERHTFVNAVLKLKSTPSPYDPALSYYDQFVAWHVELSRCDPTDPLMMRGMQMGHMGPMFLPWHREFTLLFERALGEVSGKRIAVPYWDWTDPESTRAVFSDELMGGDGDPHDGYAVRTGPFRKGAWQLNVNPIGLQWASSATPYITRHFGSWPIAPLPSSDDLQFALKAPHYDVAPYGTESDPLQSFRNALEGFRPPLSSIVACGPDGVMAEVVTKKGELHNAVHLWVGGLIVPGGGGTRVVGTMANVTTSPNDPVFFLHHSMIDRIWASWQARHGVGSYLPSSGNNHNNVDDPMHPYEKSGIRVTPADVADISELGYRYDSLIPVPRSSATPRSASGGTPQASASRPTVAEIYCRLAGLGRR